MGLLSNQVAKQRRFMSANSRNTLNTAVQSPPASYDRQAASYDQRAGLPETVCRQIAAAVPVLAQAEASDLLLEVGAGTGQIGQWFAQTSVRYLGFDLSQLMLDVFRQRLNGSKNNLNLLQADGNQPWPAADSTVRVVFSSRAIHLLEADWALQEIYRVTRSDSAALILGRVRRQRDSVKARLQQRLQQMLRQRGLSPREGQRNQQQLLDRCCQQGATMLEPSAIARWIVSSSPWQSLENWRQKSGLAGISLDAGIQQQILCDLQGWAEAEWGDLHQLFESEETYVLQGVRLGVGCDRNPPEPLIHLNL